MRFFDYIDTIEKPTVENIRAIYRAISIKYDDLIDMAVEPNSKNYKKWMQTLDCLKESENIIIHCIENNAISDMEWLELRCSIYRFQVKYGGLKYMNIEKKQDRNNFFLSLFFQFNFSCTIFLTIGQATRAITIPASPCTTLAGISLAATIQFPFKMYFAMK